MSNGLDLSKLPKTSTSIGDIRSLLPDMSELMPDTDQLKSLSISYQKAANRADESSRAFQQLREIESREVRQREQREIETLETQKRILEIHGQQLETQQKSIEINELQLQFLQKIDGNTAILLNVMDKLMSSQYTTEIYQAEMLDLLKEINMDDNYLDTMKKKFKEVTMEKGVEYGLAFIMNGIKLYIATRTGMKI